MLSSSLDWTIKLWNPRETDKCIYTFDQCEDFIYDVAWNPANYTLFSSVDSEGFLDIYDLADDYE